MIKTDNKTFEKIMNDLGTISNDVTKLTNSIGQIECRLFGTNHAFTDLRPDTSIEDSIIDILEYHINDIFENISNANESLTVIKEKL